MKCRNLSLRFTRLVALTVALADGWATILFGQTNPVDVKAKDPGPRGNPATVLPNPVPGLNHNEAALFNESLLRVSELEGTCDTCSQQPPNVPPIDPDPNNPLSPSNLVNSAGMGPIFN